MMGLFLGYNLFDESDMGQDMPIGIQRNKNGELGGEFR